MNKFALHLIIIFSVAPIFLWAWGHSRIYQHHLAGLKPDDSDGLVIKETELGLASICTGHISAVCVRSAVPSFECTVTSWRLSPIP